MAILDQVMLIPGYGVADEGGPPAETYAQQMLTTAPYVRRIGSQSYAIDKSTAGGWRLPQLGRCYLFDGTDDYVNIPDHTTLDFTNAFTWAGWYYANSSLQYDRFADKNFATAWAITHSTSRGVEFWINGVAARAIAAGPLFSLEEWFHLACTYDQSTAKIYVNGSLVGSGAYSVAIGNSTAPLRIGTTATATGEFLDGRAFDCRAYAQVLAADEITYLYTFGASGDDPGLANLRGHWKCDDTHATLAYDSSGNANHGTKTNHTPSTFHSTAGPQYSWQNNFGFTDDPTLGLVPRDESDTANDVTGAALEYTGRVPYDGALGGLPGMTFNGTDEYLQGGAISVTGDWSVSFWAKRTGSTGVQYAISLRSGDFTGSIAINGTGSPWLFFDGSTTLTGSIADTGWHHFTLTKSGTTYTLYLDGQSDGSATKNDVDINKLTIGRRDDATNYLEGQVCDVRLFSTALSAGDIATIYAGGKVTTGLIEQFPMCEGSGTTIYGTEGSTLTLTSSSPTTVHATKNTINDHLIRYGGRLDSGVYIPGDLDGALAANGSALTFGPGVLPDDGSFVNRKPGAYPYLLDVEDSHGALNTSEEVGDSTTDPNNATDTGTARHTLTTPEP